MSTQVVQQPTTEFPYFTEEHDLIRQTVTRFCKEEIAPYAAEWDEEGIFPRELFKKAGDLGLFGIRIDPKWGGGGLDWWATTAYVESLTYSDSGSVNMAFDKTFFAKGFGMCVDQFGIPWMVFCPAEQ